MSDTVVWVHGDCLTPTNPALQANSGAPAIFVFDDTYLAEYKISLKRVMFMYECLLEMPVIIRRGDVAENVLAFAAENGASHVATSDTIGPRFEAICESIRKGLPAGGRLDIVPVVPFVQPSGRLDLKRFSRYWGAVRDLALKE